MVHPAYLDDYLLTNSSYANDREKELKVLLDRELALEIEKLGFKLTSYREL